MIEIDRTHGVCNGAGRFAVSPCLRRNAKFFLRKPSRWAPGLPLEARKAHGDHRPLGFPHPFEATRAFTARVPNHDR